MGKHKNVVFLLESSPTAHLRFFEGLRMALGFSVSHRPVTLLLMGEGVRILLPISPRLLGLPPEIVEVIPLLKELGVHVIALDSDLDYFFLDRPVPDFVVPVGKERIAELVSSADIVIPFLRKAE
ncbi:MAG: DsrE family protein [Nitrospiraceae bacterium]|jgi:sulfur relay (sulfurtransferase) DsrF/TusC family protein|nr:DsrE family protein [Nitrospiraceae bacterium]